MPWTTPKAWPDGEVWAAYDWRRDVTGNLRALDQHTHSGAAGDGAALPAHLSEFV